MCGITGAFTVGDCAATVSRMTTAIRHRGPDDSGYHELIGESGRHRGAFGNRRLAILDVTSAGHQPMCSADRRFWITYNGEIYNYPELRTHLEERGAMFQSHCDTEAVILGWSLHGRDFLKMMRGMFAFALWDSKLGRGYLVRDAFGIKPLYVANVRGSILFASEVRALLESGSIERILSAEGLSSFLQTGSVAEPHTIVEGVYAVEPGCVVEIGFDDERVCLGEAERFSRPFEPDAGERVGFSESAVRLRNALRDSVQHHLLSDVPVGMFLSGGLDSSAVVAVASEVSDQPLDSFTVTFEEREFSEAEASRTVAHRFGTRHHEIPLSGADLLDALPDAFQAMDQPSLDGLNTFVVSRAVRMFGIKVVLSGLGGDELFAGYPSFRRASQISPLWMLPASIRRLLAMGATSVRGVRGEKIRLLAQGLSPGAAAYKASRTLFGDRKVNELLLDRFPQPVAESILSNGVPEKLSVLQEVSLLEITSYMRNTLLRDSDVFSMAHGLELRVPFLDRMVSKVAANAADSAKLRGAQSKPLLVAAVADLLPKSLLAQPKRGFTLPFERWMRADLKNEVEGMLTRAAAERAGLAVGPVRSVWQSFQDRRNGVTWSRPWALYTLIRWVGENDFSPPNAIHSDFDAMLAG